MRHFFLLVIVFPCVCALSACAGPAAFGWGNEGAVGLVQIRSDSRAITPGPVGHMKGQGCVHSVLGIVTFGSADTASIAGEMYGLKQVTAIDTSRVNFFNIYARLCTVVTGTDREPVAVAKPPPAGTAVVQSVPPIPVPQPEAPKGKVRLGAGFGLSPGGFAGNGDLLDPTSVPGLSMRWGLELYRYTEWSQPVIGLSIPFGALWYPLGNSAAVGRVNRDGALFNADGSPVSTAGAAVHPYVGGAALAGYVNSGLGAELTAGIQAILGVEFAPSTDLAFFVELPITAPTLYTSADTPSQTLVQARVGITL